MQVTQRTERASILTFRMSSFLQSQFDLEPGLPMLGGMPEGSTFHRSAQTVVAPSCCSLNLFETSMLSVSEKGDCDVILARHGLNPETIDEVLFDAVVRVGEGRILLRDLRLFVGSVGGRAWLVPEHSAPFLRVDRQGVSVDFEAPFRTFWERSDGLIYAARLIIAAAAGRELSHG